MIWLGPPLMTADEALIAYTSGELSLQQTRSVVREDVAAVAHKAAEIGFTYGALGRDYQYVYKNVNDMLAERDQPVND